MATEEHMCCGAYIPIMQPEVVVVAVVKCGGVPVLCCALFMHFCVANAQPCL